MPETQSFKIFCDGGARGNPGPAASAFVVQDSMGAIFFENGTYIGSTTNNQAEYRALIYSLEWLQVLGRSIQTTTEVSFYLDSQLVVNQVKGSFKVKEPQLKTLHSQVTELLHQLSQVHSLKILGFYYVPRSQNFRADNLVNKTLDEKSK